MLKGKKAIYILIPLNIAIWGFFIYRFYTAYYSYDEAPETSTKQVMQFSDVKDTVTYQLSLSYKDPFLKEQVKLKSEFKTTELNSKPKVPVQPVVKTPTTPPKPSLDIKYLGLVKNSSTGAATALININGQSHIVKSGDVVQGIQIKSIGNTSIELQEGKTKMTVVKN